MWRSSCWQASFGEALGMHASLGSGCVMETTMMTDKEFFSFFVYLFFDVLIPLELKAFQVILPASTGQMDQTAIPLVFFFWFSPFNVQLDGLRGRGL